MHELEIVEKIGAFLRRNKPAPVAVVGPWGAGKSLLAAQTAQKLAAPLVVVASGRIEAEGIYDDLCTFAGEERVALFPAWEVLPTDTMDPADDVVAERLNALQRIAQATDAGETMHVVVPVRALLQRVPARAQLLDSAILLRRGDSLPLDQLLEKLIKLGYTREVMVENRGEVSVRGGIVDIFPISSELPVRIEYFGDEIESIRRFEPETQRSVVQMDSVQILPRSEKKLLSQAARERGGGATLFDHLPKTALFALDEPLTVREEAERVCAQQQGTTFYLDWSEAEARMARYRRMSLAQMAHATPEDTERVSAPMNSIAGWAGHTDDFWEQLKQWELDGYRVQLYCLNSGERRRLYELLEEHGYRLGSGQFDLRVELGRIRAGFVSPAEKLAVLSEKEMFGRHYVRRTRRRFEAGQAITQFSDLKTGDYIVHVEHGIGRYMGLKRFPGRSADFMAIQYSGGDLVYVPVTHIDQVQKYTAGEGAVPRIDKIGGATWARAKARVKKAVKDLTEDLVKLYAARESAQGHAFSPDTPWQREFEEAFPYEETPDQARAIEEVKRDMEAPRPMDRLLCGDVGFGKTEVALRAAFKAVMDGKQVAVLAPTTVLAQQHFATFSERMADFPIRIELLNRFRTDHEAAVVVDRLKSGEVDIVIGTHRLLSKDVKFKDLGLLVIDEEQRFGVEQKEKLKKLRTHVDVLSMSATPIPRTLHFSLIGVRDMSVINTAPNDRLPIHTCIETWSESLIREAIARELNREGQVFLLHNRVQTIADVAAMVRRLVPRARVDIGHGQMPKHELEEVMARFIDKKIDVLVCTTIIGSGIDIPNANTIIMDRADQFGLSELYQIRGRVGRYKHRAFAYLLVPGDRALTEEAQQRLKALEDFSSLGSGFRIALRDLEIRGAGNLLGGEQHGHIVAVGYETYKDLIAEAVAEHRGTAVRRASLPPFEVNVEAYIPEAYVPTAMQKMTLYRRISSVHTPEEVDELQEELQDRFGPPPPPVLRLLEVMRVRALAGEAGVKAMSADRSGLHISFQSAAALGSETAALLRRRLGPALVLAWEGAPALRFAFGPEEDALQGATRVLRALLEINET